MEPTPTDPSSAAIVEVREETMISPVDGDAIPTPRTAHFLKPSLSSFTAMTSESPPSDLSLKPSQPGVSFGGWRYGTKNWKLWVEKMAVTHKPTWERAGIFDAVMNSVHEIKRDHDLVFGLAERWCSNTNTFAFPWGEATVTLEDMSVLGFSVLGSPVFRPVGETEELKDLEHGLSMAMMEMLRSASRKAAVGSWITKFRDSQSLIEHEAFLVAWLCRFVFANTRDGIRREAFPIAIHLARGTRIALAPAVLASIYRDLGILKREIINESMGSSSNNRESSIVKLGSPFQLVQLWAWERFLQVQPQPNELSRGEPRLARWSSKKMDKRVQDTRMILDSAADTFIWRPYTLPVRNWEFTPKFYGEKERWEALKSGSENDDDLVCFARCLRPSLLVGIDTIEQYFPHRVAMQFGFDQGIPGRVSESKETIDCPDDAWSDYSRALDGVSLYIPSRLFEADVTTLYHLWWKHEVVELRQGELLSLSKQDKESKKLMKKKEEKKTGVGKSTLLKKVWKQEEKTSVKTAAEGELLNLSKQDKESKKLLKEEKKTGVGKSTLLKKVWKQEEKTSVKTAAEGKLLSLSKQDKESKKLMKKEKKKTGGGKSTLLKKVWKQEEKTSVKKAADGSGSKGLLSKKTSAMSYKNAKRKNDSNNALTDIDRLVKRIRARAYGTKVKKDGSYIGILDPSPVSEAKVVRRDDDDDEEEEDRMTIGQLVKVNYKHGHAEKITNGGEVASSSLQSSNIIGAVETVSASIGDSEAAAESRQHNDGYQNHLDQSSNCQFSVAQDQTPGVGWGDVSSGQLQSHSFLAAENVVALVSPDRAATMTNVMKVEPFEESMQEVTAEARVAEVENQSNEPTVSLSGAAMSVSIRNIEVGGGSMFRPTMKRLDAQLSELEKQLDKLKAARIAGK